MRLTVTQRNTLSKLAVLACLLSGAGILRAQEDLGQKSQQAQQAMAAGQFSEAAALYRELVQALPDNPRLRLDLGLALHSEGKYEEAVGQFQAALRRDANLEPAWLMLGLSDLELNRPQDAVQPLLRVLRSDPQNERARLKLADAYLAIGKSQEAGKEFESVTKSNPANPKGWQGLGLSDAGLSRQVFGRLENLDANSPYRDALLAQSLAARGQDRTAFYWYKQALAKDSHLPGVHAALAAIYRRAGHPDWAAIEETREREQGKPDCRQASLECDLLASRFSDVIALASQEEQPVALYWEAQAYEQLSARALARLAAMPPSPEVHELMAQADVTKGDYHAAVGEWTEALRLAPQEPGLKQGLAYALWLDGSYRQAQPLLAQLLETNPQSPEIHFELGDCLLAQGSADKAISQLEEAVKLDPALTPAQASLGRAYLRVGRAQDAIAHLKAGLAADEKGTALYDLAQAYREAGQKTLADETLRKFQQNSSTALARSHEMDREHEITAP